ncbi:MAG: DegV family protein [Lachnospiraceae bacterium]|nr:DegV family protein [Lachnospiraceae bacterium]
MVKVIADSTCDLSKELIERYNITILPLHILLGEKEYEDGINITPTEIFTWSDENKSTPKTSAPSIEQAIEIFERELKGASELVVFSISEDMSTSANVSRMAAEELDASDRIHVINSKNLSTGIGLTVIEAAIMAAEGKSGEEIVDAINKIIPKVRASFVVDTLVYLHRGGRCSGLSAMLGAAIKLHPRIVVNDGIMSSDKKYRGKMRSVTLSYVQDLEEELRKAKKDRVFITHTSDDSELVDSVRKYLESLNVFDEIHETRAGGVISSHCGPGTLGVLFIDEC